jgi:hypothetical protein
MRYQNLLAVIFLIVPLGYSHYGGIAIAENEPAKPIPSEQITTPRSDSSIDEMIERQRRQRAERERQRVDMFVKRFQDQFGYDPRDYNLKFQEAGTNITVYSASFWYRLNVRPIEGVVTVQHQTVTRDIFWGTFNYYDHETLALKFILDTEACRSISDGTNCTFTGKDSVVLPNFILNHLAVLKGTWEITYVESGKTITSNFRIPPDTLPEGTREGATVAEIEASVCRSFPDNASCQTAGK